MEIKIYDNTNLPLSNIYGNNTCVEISSTNQQEIDLFKKINPEYKEWFKNTEEDFYVLWKPNKRKDK